MKYKGQVTNLMVMIYMKESQRNDVFDLKRSPIHIA